jgi:hypothetical protein
MSILQEQRLNLFLLEQKLWLLTKAIGTTNYNFAFENFFACQHKWQLPSDLLAIARIGAMENYADTYADLLTEGIRLVHTPEEHLKASDLAHWYPLISDLTAQSRVYSEIPTKEEIESEFAYPVFIKGARQTSQHKKHLSIIEDSTTLKTALELYKQDPILHWQQFVCREYIELRPVSGGSPDTIPASFEFRTFWWKGQFVGAGRYWFEADNYHWTESEEKEALALAKEAAQRLVIPFLVIDLAQRKDRSWIIIECNDAQESGYAGLSPFVLWRNILAIG